MKNFFFFRAESIFISISDLYMSSKIGGVSEIKINRHLFCISLYLHYLCT